MVRALPIELNRLQPSRPTDDPVLGDAWDFGDAFFRALRTPTARDKVRRVGPSEIGNPCDFCLAVKMAWGLADLGDKPYPDLDKIAPHVPIPGVTEDGNLAGWIGHAVDEKITRDLAEHTLDGYRLRFQERLVCGVVEGYGEITGTADILALPIDPERTHGVSDIKVLGAKSFKKAKKEILGQFYEVQRNLYGLGVERTHGFTPAWVQNLVFPRAGWKWEDRASGEMPLHVSAKFDRGLAEGALERAGILWNDYVLAGRIEALGSDPDCFDCSGVSEWI